MRLTMWARLFYSANILFLLLLLLLQGPDELLAAAFLLIANLCGLFALLIREKRWNATHWVAFLLLILTASFVLLFFAVPRTGVSYLYGAALILASFVLLVVEMVAEWRSSAMNRTFDRLHGASAGTRSHNMNLTANEGDDESDVFVEEIAPKQERKLLTRKGTKLYHKEGCAALRRVRRDEIVEISDGEAIAYGLEPCTTCKPQRD